MVVSGKKEKNPVCVFLCFPPRRLRSVESLLSSAFPCSGRAGLGIPHSKTLINKVTMWLTASP